VYDSEPGYLLATTDDQSQSWQWRVTLGEEVTLYWGDGENTLLTGTGSNEVITHNYSEAGTYSIRIDGALDEIIRVYGYTNGLLTIGDVWGQFINAQYIRLQANYFLEGDLTIFKTCTSLLELTANDCDLSFDNQQPWTGVDCNINFANNNLTSTEVDNALIAFATGGSFTGNTIELTGDNDSPTGASASAITTLENDGNTVNYTGMALKSSEDKLLLTKNSELIFIQE
jgi:hypothetical protein